MKTIQNNNQKNFNEINENMKTIQNNNQVTFDEIQTKKKQLSRNNQQPTCKIDKNISDRLLECMQSADGNGHCLPDFWKCVCDQTLLSEKIQIYNNSDTNQNHFMDLKWKSNCSLDMTRDDQPSTSSQNSYDQQINCPSHETQDTCDKFEICHWDGNACTNRQA